MEAFYVSIIFLGVLLVIGSLFFIAMDKVNGKDFFKEFDRKKEEMFNLIQDSEEMIQELNKISDYVVNVISEKNQEFFEKAKMSETADKTYNPYQASMAMSKVTRPVQTVKAAAIENNAAAISGSDNENAPFVPAINESTYQNPGEDNVQKDASKQKDAHQQKDAPQQKDVSQQKEINHGALKSQISGIGDRVDEPIANKSKLVLSGKRREVLQMIFQGMSNDEIADKLKIGKGEIELIRGLSK